MKRATRAMRLQVVMDYILENGPFIPARKAVEDLKISLRAWESYKKEVYDLLRRESRLDCEGIERIRGQILVMLSNLYAREKTITGKVGILREIAKLCGIYAPRKIEFTSTNVVLPDSVQRILASDEQLELAMQQDERILSNATAPEDTSGSLSETFPDSGADGGGDDRGV